MKLSVVVPAHNEEENISDVITRLENSLEMPFELIVVNDHSIDNTALLVEGLAKQYNNIILVENKLNKGFANALKTGFNKVSGDAVIPIMADLCDDLSSVKEMLNKINEGYDVVSGSRYLESGKRIGGSKIKGFLSCLAGKSVNSLLGVPTHDITNSFKMYRKKVIDSIKIESCAFEVSMELPLKAYYLGFKITEIPTVWRERRRGSSSFKILKLLPNYLKLYIWAIFKKLSR